VPVRAVRGATTIERDERDHISVRVRALVEAMFARNQLTADDAISLIVTATDDIHSFHPATAARACGLAEVPILGARELAVDGTLPRCIRLLLHVETERRRADIVHVFLEDAVQLRPDLVR
jgi:chorismate mutase